jgi:hypothetical protein
LVTVPGRSSVRSRSALCCDRNGLPGNNATATGVATGPHGKNRVPQTDRLPLRPGLRWIKAILTAFRRVIRMSRSPPSGRDTRYGVTDRHDIFID